MSFSMAPTVGCVLDSAKCVRCRGPTALSYPSSIVKKHHSSLSSIARLGIRYSLCQCMHVTMRSLHTCEHKLTFLSVTDTYVHTYVHCENRSLIQSLALMRLAINPKDALSQAFLNLHYQTARQNRPLSEHSYMTVNCITACVGTVDDLPTLY